MEVVASVSTKVTEERAESTETAAKQKRHLRKVSSLVVASSTSASSAAEAFSSAAAAEVGLGEGRWGRGKMELVWWSIFLVAGFLFPKGNTAQMGKPKTKRAIALFTGHYYYFQRG